MGVIINPMEKFQLITHLQVQDAKCTGYGTDTFLLCVMFARLSRVEVIISGFNSRANSESDMSY
jgi:hypothetical protein